MTGKQQRAGQRQTDRHRESQREKEMARRHREMTQGKKGKTDREKQIRVGQGVGREKDEAMEGKERRGGRRDRGRRKERWLYRQGHMGVGLGGGDGQTQEMGTE